MLVRPVAALRSRFADSLAAFGGVSRSPPLRRLALALVGSEIGRWGAATALAVLAFDAGGASALGLLTLTLFIPAGAAAPFAALLGDRYRRVRVMLGADLVRAGIWAVAAVLAFAGAPVETLYAAAALASVAGTAFRPAQAALLPSLAASPAELTAANVVSSTIESVSAFAGPAFGGVVVAATDPGVSFAVASGTFCWSAILVSRVAAPPGREERGGRRAESVMPALAAGVRAVAGEPRVRLLVGLMSAQTLVAGALLVFVPLVALDLLGAGDGGVGTLWSALGIGGIAGALAAAALVGRSRLAGPFAAGTVLWGAPLVLLGVWDSRAGAAVLLAAVGLANTVVDVAAFTILQRAVADAVLARVFGLLESLSYATHALGGILAAALVGAFGPRAALVVAGAFLPAVVALAWRRIGAIDAAAHAPSRELELLERVPFLAMLPPAELESLAAHATFVSAGAGHTVVDEGEPGDRFYVIADGTASITSDGRHLPDLGPGDGFGEIALLRDVPRTAAVAAKTDLTLLAVDRDRFLAAVTGNAPSEEAAGSLVQTRLGRTTPGLT